MLYETGKDDTCPSFKSVRFPKLQIFVEIFAQSLQSQYGAAMLCTFVGQQHGGWQIVDIFGYLGD